MMNKVHLGALAALFTLQVLAQEPAQNSSVAERIKQVEEGLHTTLGTSLLDRMKLFKVPGVSIAVINDGRLEWARGYGVLEAGKDQPVDAATKFQAASISKPVAALAALRLVQDGVLALDEDVNDKLVSWRVPSSEFTAEQKVTLRRLLSHTAGTTIHGFQGYAKKERVPTLLQILDGVAPSNSGSVVVDIVPGTDFRYSGGGYLVLQQLIMDTTGAPFPTLMRKLVLDPLGMENSSYEQPIERRFLGDVAVGHQGNGHPLPGKWNTYPEMAAAGLWTTPSDLARFALELQRSLHGDSNRILTTANTTQMLTHSGDYALGIEALGRGQAARFGHGGSNEGYRARFICFRNVGQGAVILTNSENGDKVISETMKGIARIYGWPSW